MVVDRAHGEHQPAGDSRQLAPAAASKAISRSRGVRPTASGAAASVGGRAPSHASSQRAARARPPGRWRQPGRRDGPPPRPGAASARPAARRAGRAARRRRAAPRRRRRRGRRVRGRGPANGPSTGRERASSGAAAAGSPSRQSSCSARRRMRPGRAQRKGGRLGRQRAGAGELAVGGGGPGAASPSSTAKAWCPSGVRSSSATAASAPPARRPGRPPASRRRARRRASRRRRRRAGARRSRGRSAAPCGRGRGRARSGRASSPRPRCRTPTSPAAGRRRPRSRAVASIRRPASRSAKARIPSRTGSAWGSSSRRRPAAGSQRLGQRPRLAGPAAREQRLDRADRRRDPGPLADRRVAEQRLAAAASAGCRPALARRTAGRAGLRARGEAQGRSPGSRRPAARSSASSGAIERPEQVAGRRQRGRGPLRVVRGLRGERGEQPLGLGRAAACAARAGPDSRAAKLGSPAPPPGPAARRAPDRARSAPARPPRGTAPRRRPRRPRAGARRDRTGRLRAALRALERVARRAWIASRRVAGRSARTASACSGWATSTSRRRPSVAALRRARAARAPQRRELARVEQRQLERRPDGHQLEHPPAARAGVADPQVDELGQPRARPRARRASARRRRPSGQQAAVEAVPHQLAQVQGVATGQLPQRVRAGAVERTAEPASSRPSASLAASSPSSTSAHRSSFHSARTRVGRGIVAAHARRREDLAGRHQLVQQRRRRVVQELAVVDAQQEPAPGQRPARPGPGQARRPRGRLGAGSNGANAPSGIERAEAVARTQATRHATGLGPRRGLAEQPGLADARRPDDHDPAGRGVRERVLDQPELGLATGEGPGAAARPESASTGRDLSSRCSGGAAPARPDDLGHAPRHPRPHQRRRPGGPGRRARARPPRRPAAARRAPARAVLPPAGHRAEPALDGARAPLGARGRRARAQRRASPGACCFCETLADAAAGEAVEVGYPSPEQSRVLSPTAPACVAQDVVEPLLLEHLRSLPNVRVALGTELTGIFAGPGGARVQLLDLRSGDRRTVQARHVIAADGAHSTLRRAVGIELVGPDDADDRLDDAVPRPALGGRRPAPARDLLDRPRRRPLGPDPDRARRPLAVRPPRAERVVEQIRRPRPASPTCPCASCARARSAREPRSPSAGAAATCSSSATPPTG